MMDIVLLPTQQLAKTYLQLCTHYTNMCIKVKRYPQTNMCMYAVKLLRVLI